MHRSHGCNWQRAGGYTAQDDACVELRMLSPHLLLLLQTVSVFDLTPAQRCQILRTLCDHLLSTLEIRDRIDDAFVKWRRAKLAWRESQVLTKVRQEKEASLLEAQKTATVKSESGQDGTTAMEVQTSEGHLWVCFISS